jgi:hypothetical protein
VNSGGQPQRFHANPLPHPYLDPRPVASGGADQASTTTNLASANAFLAWGKSHEAWTDVHQAWAMILEA